MLLSRMMMKKTAQVVVRKVYGLSEHAVGIRMRI